MGLPHSHPELHLFLVGKRIRPLMAFQGRDVKQWWILDRRSLPDTIDRCRSRSEDPKLRRAVDHRVRAGILWRILKLMMGSAA